MERGGEGDEVRTSTAPPTEFSFTLSTWLGRFTFWLRVSQGRFSVNGADCWIVNQGD
jgi:hypothetical protein